jgi:hypothetical protein
VTGPEPSLPGLLVFSSLEGCCHLGEFRSELEPGVPALRDGGGTVAGPSSPPAMAALVSKPASCPSTRGRGAAPTLTPTRSVTLSTTPTLEGKDVAVA